MKFGKIIYFKIQEQKYFFNADGSAVTSEAEASAGADAGFRTGASTATAATTYAPNQSAYNNYVVVDNNQESDFRETWIWEKLNVGYIL